jgi:hypothetical protein
MKRLQLVSLAALSILAACTRTAKTSPDVRTFGLMGDVEDVRYSVTSSSAVYEDDIDPFLEQDEVVLRFDEQGRVTLDDYGNVYEYDAAGNYDGIYSDYIEVVRDASGRLKSFDNTSIPDEEFDDFDVMDYCRVTYDYDAKGRVATETYAGWEWGTTTTYIYDSDKPWPAKISQRSYDEGYNENSDITFKYLEFDARGNWTKRESTIVTESYEEGAEDEKESYTQVKQETRSISYWSDK